MDLVYGVMINVIDLQNVQILYLLLIKNATKYIHNVLLMEIIVYLSVLVLTLLKLLVILASKN